MGGGPRGAGRRPGPAAGRGCRSRSAGSPTSSAAGCVGLPAARRGLADAGVSFPRRGLGAARGTAARRSSPAMRPAARPAGGAAGVGAAGAGRAGGGRVRARCRRQRLSCRGGADPRVPAGRRRLSGQPVAPAVGGVRSRRSDPAGGGPARARAGPARPRSSPAADGGAVVGNSPERFLAVDTDGRRRDPPDQGDPRRAAPPPSRSAARRDAGRPPRRIAPSTS